MQLHFHGTGAAFYPALGNNGAFFTCGDDLFLLDCGQSAFERLMAANLFERYPGSITALLTHLHADHAGSLATLALYAAEKLARPLTIVYPDDGVRTLLALMGVGELQYHLLPSLGEGDVRATPIRVCHVPSIPAFAYVIEMNGETLYYSGDAGELPHEILEAFVDGRIHHLYQDAALMDTPSAAPVHLPLCELARLIEPPLRSRVTVMHFGSDYLAQAEALGFTCARQDPLFYAKEAIIP